MLFDEVSWEEVITYRAEEARKKGYDEAVDQSIRILIESHREGKYSKGADHRYPDKEVRYQF